MMNAAHQHAAVVITHFCRFASVRLQPVGEFRNGQRSAMGGADSIDL